MNIAELHANEKEVSAISLFKGEVGTSTTIQMRRDATLKAHITKTPAFLLCITGMVFYEDEKEQKISLETGDYVLIEPNVKHWLYASVNSQLILLK